MRLSRPASLLQVCMGKLQVAHVTARAAWQVFPSLFMRFQMSVLFGTKLSWQSFSALWNDTYSAADLPSFKTFYVTRIKKQHH